MKSTVTDSNIQHLLISSMLSYFSWTQIQGQSLQGEHTHVASLTIFETEINAII